MVEDLIADDAGHFKALLAGHRVDNHVPVDADEVFRVEYAVLILRVPVLLAMPLDMMLNLNLNATCKCTRIRTGAGAAWLGGGAWRIATVMRGERNVAKYLASRVDDLSCEVLVFIPDDLAECVLNGRVVTVHEVTVDKLHRQTRLACAACQRSTSHMLRGTLARTRAPAYKQHSPTALLPTMAIFLCLGAGMVLLAFWGGRAVADLLASVKRFGLSRSEACSCLVALSSLRVPVAA